MLFLTGNQNKLQEARLHIPDLTGWEIDLPEIQSTDARQIIEAKLLEAARLKPGVHLMVEDTSLYLDALNGLPGPLIKWFISSESLGLKGLAELALQRQNTQAQAITWIGVLSSAATGLSLRFFKGEIQGQIVLPRGNRGFGWDAIFQPEGSALTFAEMDAATKDSFSMRRQALEQLKCALKADHIQESV